MNYLWLGDISIQPIELKRAWQMRIKKIELLEVIDSNLGLIGNEDTPQGGENAETMANNTTDYNQKVGTQPYRYDMLGRFGFTLLPFMEGKGEDGVDGLSEVAKVIGGIRMDILKDYYKNPERLKNDYRKYSRQGADLPEEWTQKNIELAKKVLDTVDNYIKGSKDTIDEMTVIEDKVGEKRGDEDTVSRKDDGELKEKQLKKIAGFISRLDGKDIDTVLGLIKKT